MSATPSDTGARAEAAVASALVRAGFPVFVPLFSAHSRVDLVYADEARFIGVQCKSATRVGETLRFWTCSNTGNTPKPYGAEVEAFGVFSATTNLVYLVPAVGLPSRSCFLRLSATINGQVAGVRWAKEFELGPP